MPLKSFLLRLVPSRYLRVLWAKKIGYDDGVVGRGEGKIATGRFRLTDPCNSAWNRAELFFKETD